jgi:hypothetical protein
MPRACPLPRWALARLSGPAAQQLNFTELSNLDCLINVVFDGKVFNVTVTSL